MTTYPILYTFRERIRGPRSWLDVTVHGRALVLEESAGEWWAYGVNPGGIAACGASIREAFAALHQQFRLYLQDTAKMVPSFEAFRSELQRFYEQTDSDALADWDRAVDVIRAGGELPPGMIKQAADSGPSGVEVAEVTRPTPPDTTETREDVSVAA